MNEQTEKKCDESEAPRGFRAVLKSEALPADGGNICRACDWRPTCQRPDTDFTASGHRCMAHAVVTPYGGYVERKDGCSVVFKIDNPGAE